MTRHLILNNFRNYEYVKIDLNYQNDIFVLHGKNGEGKTNVLEALSLFAGGSGLRHSKSELKIRSNSENASWSVFLSNYDGIFLCGYENGKRVYKVSDKKVRNLKEFSKGHYVLWMTYETDRLFVEPPSHRRHFIDMFCSSKFYDHDANLKKYERLARERMKILKQSFNDIMNDSGTSRWLDIIEEQITAVGLIVAKCRMEVAEDINDGQFEDVDSDFPKFTNKMSGALEDMIKSSDGGDSDIIGKLYREELRSRRQKDLLSNSTTFGPNKSDWAVFHCSNNLGAEMCSAGEQKMLLLGVFLSFIKKNIQNDRRCLMLLLDDVIAHLDSAHRVLLFKHIKKLREYFLRNDMKIVIWLSGTDRNLFEEFSNDAIFLGVQDNCITHSI